MNISPFDQLAWSTQQQLEALQHQTLEQTQTYKYWIVNPDQQPRNMFMQIPTQLTTPTLIVNHPPVTRLANGYEQGKEISHEAHQQLRYVYTSYT